jgi:DNA (cytosine-5)-methyltransferase 1
MSHREDSDTYIPVVSLCLNGGGMNRIDAESETLIPTISGTLAASGAGTERPAGNANETDMIIAFQESQAGCCEYDTAGTLRADGPGHDPVGTRVRSGMAVRRLTPLECERLQGFPDGWTDVPYRGKSAADGPRYKAIGNSMAVPIMKWILSRIIEVERIVKDLPK